MSQPALSASVKNLERELGVQLFNRNTRQVELTAAGRVFVDEARDLAAHAERVVALVRKSAVQTSGHLKIGYSPCFNVAWLSSLIAKINRIAESPVSVTLISVESSRHSELLLKGEVHACFSIGQIPHAEFHSETLFREEFLLAFSSEHPLARRLVSRGPELALADLAGIPVVWLRRDNEPWLYAGFLDSCAEREYHPVIQQEVTTFQECIHFARESLGITFLPFSICRTCHDDSIVSVRLTDDGIYVESSLLYRSNTASASLDYFRSLVRKHVANEALHRAGIDRSPESKPSKNELDAARLVR